MAGRLASRADETIGPSKPLKVVEACCVIREPGVQISIAARIIAPCSKTRRRRLCGGRHSHILYLQHSHGHPFFFLTAGQRLLSQSSMASSSRCRARRIGFCWLQPQARRIRLTWAGWYCTPNSALMTQATRSQVHTSPRKPTTSAPSRRISSRRMSSASPSRGIAPGGLRSRSASRLLLLCQRGELRVN
jgi:hypothetical protein